MKKYVPVAFLSIMFNIYADMFIMAALWNRADHHIFVLWFLLYDRPA